MDSSQKRQGNNNFLVYGEIYLAIQVNAFLYFMSKLPVLGKIVQNSWYSRYQLKKVWSLFSLAFGFIKSSLANNIGTLAILYIVPHLIMKDEKITAGVYFILFILLKCIGGMVLDCELFKASAEDYTFLNHFMVNPVSYYRHKALKNTFFSSVMLFPVIYFLFRDWKMTASIVVFKIFCKLFGNVVYLSCYHKYGHLPSKRSRRLMVLPFILLAYIGALLGWYENVQIPPVWMFVMGIASAALALCCWIYHLRYTDYRRIAVKFAGQSAVSFQIAMKSGSIGEEEDGLLESGWEQNREFFNAHQNETPENYLEMAFFNRFGKILRREKRNKVLVQFLIGVVLGLGIRFGWIPVTSETVLDYSPLLIAFATSMTFAQHLMQIYFRNIDSHMLYHHIMTPEFIRNSMLKRYLNLLRGDLFSAAAIAANIFLMMFLSGLSLPVGTVVKLSVVCIAYLIFWETYECIVYYTIQPYSVDMTAKSPLFKVLGCLESIFYLLVLFVRRDLTAALPWVCIIAAVSVVMFFMSRKFAPRLFRLR